MLHFEQNNKTLHKCPIKVTCSEEDNLNDVLFGLGEIVYLFASSARNKVSLFDEK
jgi:hypothetical protein